MHRRHFLAVLLSATMLAACSRRPTGTTLSPGATVLAFGDSVTAGVGASAGEDWPTLLAGLSGWNVVNGGISGDTAEAGRRRLGALLDEHQPALVIVEIGGNDFLRRRAVSAVKEDLRAILREARSSGAQVVLVGVPELSVLTALTRKPSDAPLYEELSKEEGVALIPDVFSDILGQEDLKADTIHPNARGYRKMAAELHAQLQKLGFAR